MPTNPATRLCQVLSVTLLMASPCFVLESPLPVPVLVPPDPVVKETKRVQNVRKLEDERLKSCADKGDQWEHCFFYGTGNTALLLLLLTTSSCHRAKHRVFLRGDDTSHLKPGKVPGTIDTPPSEIGFSKDVMAHADIQSHEKKIFSEF